MRPAVRRPTGRSGPPKARARSRAARGHETREELDAEVEADVEAQIERVKSDVERVQADLAERKP